MSEIEKLMRTEKFDFLQINYSLMEPEAEQSILPLARERGVALIANRPFGAGDLFQQGAFENLCPIGPRNSTVGRGRSFS